MARQKRNEKGQLEKGQAPLNTSGKNGQEDIEQIFDYVDKPAKESMEQFFKVGYGLLAGLYSSDAFQRQFKRWNMKDKVKFSLDLARILNAGIDKVEFDGTDDNGDMVIRWKGKKDE